MRSRQSRLCHMRKWGPNWNPPIRCCAQSQTKCWLLSCHRWTPFRKRWSQPVFIMLYGAFAHKRAAQLFKKNHRTRWDGLNQTAKTLFFSIHHHRSLPFLMYWWTLIIKYGQICSFLFLLLIFCLISHLFSFLHAVMAWDILLKFLKTHFMRNSPTPQRMNY